jgi:sodium/bile acid cotransporter 7
MRPKRRIHLTYWVLTVLLCLASCDPAERKISDTEKKEVVYRMYAGYKKDFPEVKDISPQQAIELFDQGKVVFVDTRKRSEIAVSMIPGAVTKQELLSQTERYKDKTIVGYCTISYRSGVFAREMAKDGLPVLNLQGGILAWTLEGGKVFDQSGKEVKRVHVYGDKWDYAPEGYESVKFSRKEQLF